MSTETAFTFVTLDQVVSNYLRYRPIIDYQAEAARVAKFYGAGIIPEPGNDCFFDKAALEKRLNELIITEDAEVISIETVSCK